MSIDRLNEVVQRSSEGYIGAHEAAGIAIAMGAVLVGTAVSMEVHKPTVPLSCDSGQWEPPTTEMQSPRAFRATSLPSVAIWSSYGGNVNVPFQRLVTNARPILPESSPCYLGTFGWDAIKGGMGFRLHPHIPATTEHLPDDTPIGAIDILSAQHDMRQQTSEPGNLFLLHDAPTIGSLIVRMGDVRQIPFSTEFFERRYGLNSYQNLRAQE